MKKPGQFMIPLLAAICVVLGLAATPFAASMEEVRKEAERGGYQLITTEELRGMVSREPGGVLLVDTRQEWEYAAGHLAGAVNFPMEPTWLSRLTRRGELEQLLGPDKEKRVVFY
jgi:predicted sulfurtransferase